MILPMTESEVILPPGIVRDPIYYYPTGDCTFLVANTLFRVHKAFLARDESMFIDMFRIPEPTSPSSQNNTDDDPLILHDDTANQFRALCWVLYALPPETHKQYSNSVNMTRLMDLSIIAHKYNFVAIEGWCNDLLLHHCLSGIKFLSKCSAVEMEVLADIASRGRDDDFREIIQDSWLGRLKTRALPISHALLVGEKHKWRDFLGKAYYEQLRQLRLSHTGGALQVLNLDKTNLNEQQRYRLLHGFCSLSMFWDTLVKRRFRKASSNLSASSSWSHHRDASGCKNSMSKMWDVLCGEVLKGQSAGIMIGDILENLNYMIEKVPSFVVNDCCQNHIVKRVRSIHDDLSKELADHFLGPKVSGDEVDDPVTGIGESEVDLPA